MCVCEPQPLTRLTPRTSPLVQAGWLWGAGGGSTSRRRTRSGSERLPQFCPGRGAGGTSALHRLPRYEPPQHHARRPARPTIRLSLSVERLSLARMRRGRGRQVNHPTEIIILNSAVRLFLSLFAPFAVPPSLANSRSPSPIHATSRSSRSRRSLTLSCPVVLCLIHSSALPRSATAPAPAEPLLSSPFGITPLSLAAISGPPVCKFSLKAVSLTKFFCERV